MRAKTILTERLMLNPLRPVDADEMAQVLGDERLHEFIGGRPLSLDELRARYRRLSVGRSEDGSRIWLNWIMRRRADGLAVGTIQATLTPGVGEDRRAHIAWVVGVRWQRQGIASEAAQALVAWLEERGVTSISANVHPDHEASRRVAGRAGLVPTDEKEDGEQVWRRP